MLATIVGCTSSSNFDGTRTCNKAFDGCHAPYRPDTNAELQATWRIVSDIHPQMGWCVPYSETDGSSIPLTVPAAVMGHTSIMKGSLDECELACHAPCNAVQWHRVTRLCSFYTTSHAWANANLPTNARWACDGHAEFAWKRTETDCSHGQLPPIGMWDDVGVAWAATSPTASITLTLSEPTTINGMRYANRWYSAASMVRSFTATFYDQENTEVGQQSFYHHCYTSDGYVTHPDEPWRGCVDTNTRWDIATTPVGTYAIPAPGHRGTNVDSLVSGSASCNYPGGAECTYNHCRELCDASSAACHAFHYVNHACSFYSDDFDLSSMTSVDSSGPAEAYGFRRGPKGNDFDKHIFRFKHAYALVQWVRIDILSTWGGGSYPGAREVEFGYYTVGERLDDGLLPPASPSPFGKCSGGAANLLPASHMAPQTAVLGSALSCFSVAAYNLSTGDAPFRIEFDIAVTTSDLAHGLGSTTMLLTLKTVANNAVLIGLDANHRPFYRWSYESTGLQSNTVLTEGTHRLTFQFDGHLRSILIDGAHVMSDEPFSSVGARRMWRAQFTDAKSMCPPDHLFVGTFSNLKMYSGVPCGEDGAQSPPPPPPPLAGDNALMAYWKFDGDDPLADAVHGHRLVRIGGMCAASDERAHWTHVRDRHSVDALPHSRGRVLNQTTSELEECQRMCDQHAECAAVIHNTNTNECELLDHTYDIRSSRPSTDSRRFYFRDCSDYAPGWARLGGHGTQLVLDGTSQYMHMAFPDTSGHTDRVGMTVDNNNGFTVCAIAATVNAYPDCDQSDDFVKCYPVLVSNGQHPVAAASDSAVGERGWSLGMNRRMCRCGSYKQHLAAWGPHHTSVQLGGFSTASIEAEALAEYDDPTRTTFDGVFTGRRSNSIVMPNGILGDIDDLTWGVRSHDTRIRQPRNQSRVSALLTRCSCLCAYRLSTRASATDPLTGNATVCFAHTRPNPIPYPAHSTHVA